MKNSHKITFNITLFVSLFIFNMTSAQETTSTPPASQSQLAKEFSINKDEGLTDYIIINCEGKTKEELYKKTIEWINKNYNKPSEVIKAQVENDYIRFQGVSKNEYCFHNMLTVCSDIKYEIEVSFKDGKYKFDVLELSNSYQGSYGITKWSELNFANSWTHFKKDGEVRKMYSETLPRISGYFNNLNKSLYDYIYNKNETAKSNDW